MKLHFKFSTRTNIIKEIECQHEISKQSIYNLNPYLLLYNECMSRKSVSLYWSKKTSLTFLETKRFQFVFKSGVEKRFQIIILLIINWIGFYVKKDLIYLNSPPRKVIVLATFRLTSFFRFLFFFEISSNQTFRFFQCPG